MASRPSALCRSLRIAGLKLSNLECHSIRSWTLTHWNSDGILEYPTALTSMMANYHLVANLKKDYVLEGSILVAVDTASV